MKIDRHNYEEFFILYWDNELTAVQKQAVENFVDQNADLRVEFEIFGETRFTSDATIRFKEKDFLTNDSFINITNYEEQLLNYIDDEVTDDERKEVEKFVGQIPAAQKELALLQKTKLQPEVEIGFPDKSVLYKREEKPVRVISMTWFRVAVAAAIILLAGLTVFQFVNTGKSGDTNPVVKINESKNIPVSNEEKDSKKTSTATTKDQDIAKTDDKLATDTQKINSDHKTIKNKVEENSLTSTSTKKLGNENNLPNPGRDITPNGQDATQEVITRINTPLKRDSNVAQKTSSGFINASLVESDVTLKNNPTLDIPEQQAKEKDGGGIKEFLRKTTRVFERRTKIQTTTDDNKLLVGAFAVSLK